MILFGCLTLNNIHQRRRVLPIIGENNRATRRTDSQLLRMLTAQVLCIVISTLLSSVERLYLSITENIVKDSIRVAQENLATQTVNAMTYFAHSTTFYLYTLTGAVFRKEVFKIFHRCFRQKHKNPVNISNDSNKRIILEKQQRNINATSDINKP
ncbi:unnamed protein product [Adineta steineri]|uniref:G-protein coupled receptors family 1 profile domain-containing protein n=1 Tax=Adineta steineri TaxID=433720 RepID=A0A814LFH2_9BILA|nr:unnamed protein product [Adineta steineri]CAF1161151.1 unnamed protein product [Adineta steineri]